MIYKNRLKLLVIFLVPILLGVAFYFVVTSGLLFTGVQKPESGPRTVFSEVVKQKEEIAPTPEGEPVVTPPPSLKELELKEDVTQEPITQEKESLAEPEQKQEEVVKSTPTTQPEPERQVKEYTVLIKEDGFHPDFITIQVGDTVRWVNTDTNLHWPSADPHPTHSDLSDFDPLADLLPGEFYRYTFTEAGAVGYHDHTQAEEEDEATVTGTVRVLP